MDCRAPGRAPRTHLVCSLPPRAASQASAVGAGLGQGWVDSAGCLGLVDLRSYTAQ